MIRPIQPVSCYRFSPALAICSERARLLACLARKDFTPDCFTFLIGVRRQDMCINAAKLTTPVHPKSEAVQSDHAWQPWPGSPAYADEVTRWWPSDEKPLISEVEHIDVRASDSGLVFIPVPVRGGMLNLSA